LELFVYFHSASCSSCLDDALIGLFEERMSVGRLHSCLHRFLLSRDSPQKVNPGPREPIANPALSFEPTKINVTGPPAPNNAESVFKIQGVYRIRVLYVA